MKKDTDHTVRVDRGLVEKIKRVARRKRRTVKAEFAQCVELGLAQEAKENQP